MNAHRSIVLAVTLAASLSASALQSASAQEAENPPRQTWSALVTSGDVTRTLLAARAPGPRAIPGPHGSRSTPVTPDPKCCSWGCPVSTRTAGPMRPPRSPREHGAS